MIRTTDIIPSTSDYVSLSRIPLKMEPYARVQVLCTKMERKKVIYAVGDVGTLYKYICGSSVVYLFKKDGTTRKRRIAFNGFMII